MRATPSRHLEPDMPHTAPDISRRLTRRSFLAAAGLAPVAATLGGRHLAAAPARIPLAVQLYSVRDDCKRDFDAAIAAVAAMGITGVEFAGYHSYEGRAADLRRRLDALNLKAAGTHISMKALRGDALKATIDFHQAIGCRFLIVPGDDAFTDPEGSKALADTFNGLAETLKPLGMACGYHNHTKELEKTGNTTWWDLFAERTGKDVILQQDCGWTFAAGYDPVAYVRKYPGRTRTTHFKPTIREGETAKQPIIGRDSVDWASVYAACAAVGGTEWIVVEQEKYLDGKTPMECTRESVAGLKALLP
jgi:sugar phosphate isomerase/epimerase